MNPESNQPATENLVELLELADFDASDGRPTRVQEEGLVRDEFVLPPHDDALAM